LLADVAAGRVLGPYEQVDRHGRRQSSVSVLVNAGRMLLCINFDRTLVDSAAVSLAAFAAPREEQPAALFHRDWRAHVNRLIDDWCLEHGVSRSGINRSQRLALIADLDGRGVFDTRNAAAHVASALDVSRATVYALRKEHSGSRTTGQQT
jgi:predicted transcriptional regulator YheO